LPAAAISISKNKIFIEIADTFDTQNPQIIVIKGITALLTVRDMDWQVLIETLTRKDAGVELPWRVFFACLNQRLPIHISNDTRINRPVIFTPRRH